MKNDDSCDTSDDTFGYSEDVFGNDCFVALVDCCLLCDCSEVIEVKFGDCYFLCAPFTELV